MTVSVLWLSLTVPWVGLQCVIVVFHDHTHLLFGMLNIFIYIFISFLHEFNEFRYTGARMLDYIYHISLKK